MSYRLLQKFEALFEGKAYLHRASNLGDSVAMELYEDLYALGRSKTFMARVQAGTSVLNTQNRRQGVKARRGDGSFGEIVPQVTPIADEGYAIKRAAIATIEIGVEVKILMKAMIKQIDRVGSDLRGQAAHFQGKSGTPIAVGVVGINHAAYCTSYEGDRTFRTDGRKYKHPVAEAKDAEDRLVRDASPAFDEFLVLRFRAVNEAPFDFEWVNEKQTALDYGAILARISQKYEKLF
ncbi:MAG TPA: hypothetical protein VG735_08230 [Caulobacterales bacterium]|nr:hypothetical protein [Caulobacterales bacterium]